MPKIILITHQKGGVGKSTLTFNLALNISNNAQVAVLDLDLQGSLSQLKELVSQFDIISLKGEIKTILSLNYDFVFIDTPPYLSNHLNELIKLSELILVPTKAGVLDALAIKSTLDLIKKNNKTENTLIVFNMIKANTTLTQDILTELKEYGIPIAKTYISDLVAYTKSVLTGSLSRNKNAQSQLDKLTKEILLKLI